MRVLFTFVFCALLGLGTCQLTKGQPDPCKLKQNIVVDNTHCDRYWECIRGEPYLFDCPNGLVFVGRNRGIADGCDYPWRANQCHRGRTQINPPISSEHCDWLYGIFGHETSCTRYWTCWNGTAAEQFCIGGLLYNEDTHACDWPQNVAGCQKHPLCKDDPNGNVPLGKSCERYWSCQGGYPRLQRCPATLVFDKLSRRCVNPPTEDCDIPTTEAPLEQEGSSFREGGGPPRRGRPQSRPRQQLQEQPLQQFDDNQQQLIEEPVGQPQQVRSPSRPRLPPKLPIIKGAIPIQFNANSGGFRPTPISGSVALN